MIGDTLSPEVEAIAKQIVDAAFKVHSQLGPGLLESAYEACLGYELAKRGLSMLHQVRVPLVYDGVELDADFRIDLLVEDCGIVEVKAVEKMNSIYDCQVLTYLKLSHHQLGFLINFNVRVIANGIKRIILSHPPASDPTIP